MRTSLIALFLLSILAPLQAQDEGWHIILPGGEKWRCIVADTPIERASGLRHYDSLPPQTCMLFIYPEPQETSFWMPPDMQFDLDMLFLDAEGRITHMAKNAVPCPDPSGYDCPVYSPDFPVSYVVEFPAGTIDRSSLEMGQQVRIVVP